MRKVGVTGGAGFIGRYVVEELQSKGYVPVVLDHHRRSPGEYDPSVEVFLGDVTDEVAMTEFAAHVDGIVHLAAVLGTQETIKNPTPAIWSNMLGGLNFLESVAQYGLPAVYIAVGNHWMDNPYSISKTAVERLCRMYNADRGTRVNVVRAVNAYGPRQLAAEPFAHGKVRKVTPSLVCRALSGMPMELYGGGAQVSDMVYVGDVARALVLALEKAAAGVVLDRPVEIGSIKHTTIRQVADRVAEICRRKGYEVPEVASLPMRPGETVGTPVTADVSTLAYIDFPIEELVPLDVGLLRTVDYFIESEGTAWHRP